MSRKDLIPSEWELIMGLEVHCQLATAQKLFCDCSTQETLQPNSNICPICMGYPGILPKLNPKAVAFATKAALAVGCRVNETSEFSRKHYFYPDLPKGYQITQFRFPLAEHGKIGIGSPTKDGSQKYTFDRHVIIRRVHMEEDAGKNVHLGNNSYVNFNRAGVPLIEIVSEPFDGVPYHAAQYLRHLHWILLSTGITKGSLEEGNLRCDVNVSVRPKGSSELRTRVEVKNLNSYRFIERAIVAEVKRQVDLYKKGQTVAQETRLYDQKTGETRLMRSKEEAMDYRYFPEPDLPLLKLRPEWIKQHHFVSNVLQEKSQIMFESSSDEKQANTLMANGHLRALYWDSVKAGADPKVIKDWVLTTVIEHVTGGKVPVTGQQLCELIALVSSNTINQLSAKEVFKNIAFTPTSPRAYVKEKGLEMTSQTDDIRPKVQAMLKDHPQEWKRFCEGDDKLLKFFMGQVMRVTQGKINPKVATEIIHSLKNDLKGV